MPLSRRLTTTLTLSLLLHGCGGDTGSSAPPADAETAVQGATQTANAGGPAIPLPQPEGERAVGARIWEYQIEVTRDTVPAGDIEFHVVNAGTTEHWLIVRDDELFEGTPHLFPGDSAVLRVNLEPGEYNLVCTIRDEFDHISEGERRLFVVI